MALLLIIALCFILATRFIYNVARGNLLLIMDGIAIYTFAAYGDKIFQLLPI